MCKCSLSRGHEQVTKLICPASHVVIRVTYRLIYGPLISATKRRYILDFYCKMTNCLPH